MKATSRGDPGPVYSTSQGKPQRPGEFQCVPARTWCWTDREPPAPGRAVTLESLQTQILSAPLVRLPLPSTPSPGLGSRAAGSQTFRAMTPLSLCPCAPCCGHRPPVSRRLASPGLSSEPVCSLLEPSSPLHGPGMPGDPRSLAVTWGAVRRRRGSHRGACSPLQPVSASRLTPPGTSERDAFRTQSLCRGDTLGRSPLPAPQRRPPPTHRALGKA